MTNICVFPHFLYAYVCKVLYSCSEQLNSTLFEFHMQQTRFNTTEPVISKIQNNTGNICRHIQISLYIIPIMLHTAVVSTARPPVSTRRNGQTILYQCQKRFPCWEHIVYRDVMTGPIIKPLAQSINQRRLNTIILVAPLFKWN